MPESESWLKTMGWRWGEHIAHLLCFQDWEMRIPRLKMKRVDFLSLTATFAVNQLTLTATEIEEKLLLFKKISNKTATKLLILGTIIVTIKMFRVSPN